MAKLYFNGTQILTTTDGIGNILTSTELSSSGYTTGALTSTWLDTHNTLLRTRSLQENPNPTELVVQDTVFITDNPTLGDSTATIAIQANESGGVGTFYGMNLYNSTNTDFVIQSDPDYTGGVLFKQVEGTTETKITQGEIEITSDTDSMTLSPQGITTTTDLVLDIGGDFALDGTITESTAGGFTGEYLKIKINGTIYKLQLLSE
jgi:hypothetical protein